AGRVTVELLWNSLGGVRTNRRRPARRCGMGPPGLSREMHRCLSQSSATAVQLTDPWSSNEVSSSGQVFEFRLWAALTEQSRGLLPVFLPLSDRGIDALVHRRSDDAYI